MAVLGHRPFFARPDKRGSVLIELLAPRGERSRSRAKKGLRPLTSNL